MNLKSTILVCAGLCLLAPASFGQAATDTATVTNAPPKHPWDVSAAAGLTLTRGNSKTLLFTANALGVKKWDQNEINLGADGVYGENDGEKNAEAAHGFGQYNRLFSERFFGYARVDGLHDAIADIDYRFSVGPGVGYYFLKSTNTTLRAEIGPSYIYEHDGDGTDHSYMSLRLAERFDKKLNSYAKIWESVEFLPQVDRWGNYIINAEAGIETTMSKRLSLLAYIQDFYHSEPAAGRLKNDLKLVTAIKYTFGH